MLPRLKPNEARYNGNFGGPRTGLDNIFNVENITYDAVGNIQTLNRRGIIACDEEGNLADGYIDQLTYGYYPNSNRLRTVTDAATEEGLAEQGVTPHIGAYTYDAAGRMTGDPHRDMTITYNHLDLPATITVDGKKTYITYDATGRKWLQSSAESSVFYVGPFTYKLAGKDFELEAANLADGRIVHDTRHRELFTEYYHKDHLGNIRVAFTDRNDDGRVSIVGAGSEITQQNDFYPFGMAHAGEGVFHGDVGGNRYRYNGKEFSEELGLYDYGARWYDPNIARWTSVDPLASEMASWSPYNYVFNNPLKFTDPTGMSPDGGIVTKVKNEDGSTSLNVTAIIYIYGDQADSDLAGDLQTMINSAWNNDGSVINFKGKDYDVTFDISVEAVTVDEAATLAEGNTDGSKNFLRVFEGGGDIFPGSAFVGNSGKLDLNQNEKSGETTAPHEAGHMFGFRNDNNPTGDETHFSQPNSQGGLSMMYSGPGDLTTRSVSRKDVVGLRLTTGLFGSRRQSKKIGGPVNNVILRTNKEISDFNN